MNKTKKGFLIAGGILAIISAVLAVLSCYALANMTEEIVREAVVNSEFNLTPEQTDSVVKLLLQFFKYYRWIVLAFGIVDLVLGILILVGVRSGSVAKGLIIAELVFAILQGRMITIAIMIVALCIKDKPKTNIETIAV